MAVNAQRALAELLSVESVSESKGAEMIEGKLGHHFQVDEMRHIASPACPAFTGCWSAERRCCSCTARPTCPALPADKSAFWLKLLSARTGSSACPVYVVHEGVGKALTFIWQHLLQLIWVASLHRWVQMLSAACAPPANPIVSASGFSRGNIQDGSSTACPRTAQHFTSDRLCIKSPYFKGCDLGDMRLSYLPKGERHSQARAPGPAFWGVIPHVCRYSTTRLDSRCWLAASTSLFTEQPLNT